MIHRNAPLIETGRLRPARCVVDDGWPVRRAAERFQVSHTTAARWATRYRTLGVAGMSDRSSRPHHQPARTPTAVEEQVLRLRREHRIGPLRLAARCGIAASTAHRILARHGLPPLAALDRATGEPIRRYERSRPGELIHIDVKKLGRIPDGGGHKTLGRAEGRRNKTGSGWAYSKNTWRDTCRDLGISPRWTQPWRPQTNGKVERFHRTLLEEWAYQQPYTSDRQCQEAFTDWIDWYNYHRPHTGISGQTPASRVTNLPGQHI
ncbi:integrase core domain-containing protein [Streptomyces sp. NPDC059917]|uniref:integrase core domain-containing protein n=1 Tax=Streptomyces sp. NPDC059917 TaxID=3347002 RepID=UPI0036573FBB